MSASESQAAPCRLLLEREPRSGALNMALDEVLLEAAADRGICSLRLYRWSEATVSLGYFQTVDEARRDPALAGVPVVRRLSGGGAILHHHEWTYSCAVPAGHRLAREPFQLYDHVHGRIAGWLQSLGIDARPRGAAGASAKPAHPSSEPFLCFGRGDPRDLVLDGFKVLGSAQRRRRGAILQHGSLLIRASRFASQFPGLCDLSGRDDLEQIAGDEMAAALAPLFDAAPGALSDEEEAETRRLARASYQL